MVIYSEPGFTGKVLTGGASRGRESSTKLRKVKFTCVTKLLELPSDSHHAYYLNFKREQIWNILDPVAH